MGIAHRTPERTGPRQHLADQDGTTVDLGQVQPDAVYPTPTVSSRAAVYVDEEKPALPVLAPPDAEVGEATRGERGLDGKKHEEHDRYPETKGLELGPRGAAR